MPDTKACFSPNFAVVASKIIDGEAVIMNFANGLYYSLDEAGTAIWSGIEAGRSIADIATHVAAHYEVTAEQAEADVNSLLSVLLKENLVVTTGGGAASAASDAPKPESLLPYSEPELMKHEDMAELLALDPPMPGLGDTTWKNPDGET